VVPHIGERVPEAQTLAGVAGAGSPARQVSKRAHWALIHAIEGQWANKSVERGGEEKAKESGNTALQLATKRTNTQKALEAQHLHKLFQMNVRHKTRRQDKGETGNARHKTTRQY